MSVVERNNRRAIKKDLTGDLTEAEWFKSLDYFDDKCAYCECKLIRVVSRPKRNKTRNKRKKKVRQTQNYKMRTLEHIECLNEPNSAGTTAFNVIPACDKCNNSKGEKDIMEWFPKQEFFTEDNLDKIIDYRKEKYPILDIKNYKLEQDIELELKED